MRTPSFARATKGVVGLCIAVSVSVSPGCVLLVDIEDMAPQWEAGDMELGRDDESSPVAFEQTVEAAGGYSERYGPPSDSGFVLVHSMAGGMSYDFDVPAAGTYSYEVRAFQKEIPGPEPTRMNVSLNGRIIESFDVPNTSPETFSSSLEVQQAGVFTLMVSLDNDYNQYDSKEGGNRDLFVSWVRVYAN